MASATKTKKKCPPTNQEWFLPEKGTYGDWYPVVRVGRHIPFGYKQDENDIDILIPIPHELEALEMGKKLLNEYSLRNVSHWLEQQTGRAISHVGLKKRVTIEETRRKSLLTHRSYAQRWKEAAAKEEKLAKKRIGGEGLKDLHTKINP